jgi:uncharacterized membrane protein YidH (DUF202 family)
MIQIWLKITLIIIVFGGVAGAMIGIMNLKRKDYEYTIKQDFWYSNYVIWGIWAIGSIVMWGFY